MGRRRAPSLDGRRSAGRRAPLARALWRVAGTWIELRPGHDHVRTAPTLEDRAGGRALRERAAAAVRGHRADRVVPDRGAHRTRPRRHAVRERSLAHRRAAGRRLLAGAAARGRHRPAPSPRRDARGGRPGRVRPHPRPRRLPALPADLAAGDPDADDAPRAPRSPRARSAVRGVPGHARGLELRRLAGATARDRVAGDRRPRAAVRPPPAVGRDGRRPRVCRPDLAGEARRSRHRDRAACGPPDADCRQDRPRRPRIRGRVHRAAVRCAGGDLPGRARRGRQGRAARRGARAAVPDRLVRAVRPPDDRGDGVWYAGDRVRARLGARGRRRRRLRVRSSASTSSRPAGEARRGSVPVGTRPRSNDAPGDGSTARAIEMSIRGPQGAVRARADRPGRRRWRACHTRTGSCRPSPK